MGAQAVTRPEKYEIVKVLLFGSILTLLSACTFGLPSDQALIRRFDQNRGDFEQLVETAQSLESIGVLSTRGIVKDEVPEPQESERQRYFQLLEKLGIQSASKSSQLGEKLDVIYLETSWGGNGWAFSWAEKGYAYLLEEPLNTVERPFRTTQNLNRFNRELSGGSELMFRHIDGRWYLYFMRDQS